MQGDSEIQGTDKLHSSMRHKNGVCRDGNLTGAPSTEGQHFCRILKSDINISEQHSPHFFFFFPLSFLLTVNGRCQMGGFGDYNATFSMFRECSVQPATEASTCQPVTASFKGYKSNSIFMLFCSSFLVLIMPIRAVVLVMQSSAFQKSYLPVYMLAGTDSCRMNLIQII